MPRALRQLGLALGVALMAGCAMGPDYERPELPVPAEYDEVCKWSFRELLVSLHR